MILLISGSHEHMLYIFLSLSICLDFGGGGGSALEFLSDIYNIIVCKDGPSANTH